MANYRVLVGVNYRDQRAEPGDVVDDLPRSSVGWLRDQGKIELVGKESLVQELEPELDEYEVAGDDEEEEA